MKLFFLPGACSLAPHIAMLELGIKPALEKVNPKDKSNLLEYNPKGYVPTLITDDDQVLTEASVILQYLADQKPKAGLMPSVGTWERYQCMEWLNFVATELHKGFSPLFKDYSDEIKTIFRQNLDKRIGHLDQHLATHKYLMGETVTVADIYAYVVLNWTKFVKWDISHHKNVMGFLDAMGNRPAVQEAIQTEKRTH
ncbi:MAG: glutathione transferase GstA [Oligoflexales bacterium]